VFFFFSSRRRHTRFSRDWSSDVCSSDLHERGPQRTSIDPGCQTSVPRFLWETDLKHNETAPGRQAHVVAGRPGVFIPCPVSRGAWPRGRSIPVLAPRPSAHFLLVLVELLLPLLVLPLVLLPILVLVPVLVPVLVLVLPVVLLIPLVAVVLVLPEREEDQVFLLPAGARAPRQHLHWSPSLRGGWDGRRALPPRGHHDRMPGYRNAAPQGTRRRRSVKGFFGLRPGAPG